MILDPDVTAADVRPAADCSLHHKTQKSADSWDSMTHPHVQQWKVLAVRVVNN